MNSKKRKKKKVEELRICGIRYIRNVDITKFVLSWVNWILQLFFSYGSFLLRLRSYKDDLLRLSATSLSTVASDWGGINNHHYPSLIGMRLLPYQTGLTREMRLLVKRSLDANNFETELVKRGCVCVVRPNAGNIHVVASLPQSRHWKNSSGESWAGRHDMKVCIIWWGDGIEKYLSQVDLMVAKPRIYEGVRYLD